MPTLSGALDLQRRSRRNALHATVSLRRQRAESVEAQNAALAGARLSLRDRTPDLHVDR